MSVETKELRISRLADQDKYDDLFTTTPAQRIEMMWQLALDAWAFKGDTIAELRLPRHIVRVLRRES
jgi:hypothetical protein